MQAKVYLALTTLGNATVKKISMATNIARQEIYRVLPTLLKLGLVVEVVAMPTIYKAMPLKEAVSILLQYKTEEYNDLQKKTAKLLNNSRQESVKTALHAEASQFIVISEKKLLYKMLDEENRTVQKSLEVAGKWANVRNVLFGFELDVFKSALQRGVRIRWLTETHKEDKSILKTLRLLEKNPLFELRYLAPPVPIQTAIYDEKVISLHILKTPKDEVTSLWSNNAVLVKVVKNYFDEIWGRANKHYLPHAKAKEIQTPDNEPLIPH